MESYLDSLKEQFGRHVRIVQKRPDTYQLIAPLYHEDGDIVDIYLQPTSGGKIRICDFGMSLMRLSYSFEIDTENKERIFEKILAENLLQEDNGNIFLDADLSDLYPSLLQFAQGVAKVTNLDILSREN